MKPNGWHVLCLSFNPLFALRIDFLECETFFFGTASKNGGMSSMSDSHADCNEKPKGFGATWRAGRKALTKSGLAKGSLNAGSSGRAAGRARAAMGGEREQAGQASPVARSRGRSRLNLNDHQVADHVPSNASAL